MEQTVQPLRAAIISDSQAYPTLSDWGMDNLNRALQFLAPMKPDVLLMAGDLADGTNFETYKVYRQLLEKHFDPMPVHVGCAGNHDYWVPKGTERDPEFIYSEMSRLIGQKNANPLHETVGGYDFIAFSEDIKLENGYSPEMIWLLEKEIKKSVERDPEKPVFVISHYHPVNTVTGSHTSSGRPELRELFNRYPQVVSISGHTHCPLEDERCIWQGEFTAINSSTLAYGCVEESCCYNNCSVIAPFADEVLNVMLMEIYPDHCDIHRYNIEDRREIKPDNLWSFPLPHDPANPKYSDYRRLERSAPEFPPGAYGVLRYDYGFLYVIFDQAVHEDFVHFYIIKVYEKTDDGWVLKSDEYYLNDFYRLEGRSKPRQVFKLPGEIITPGCEIRVEIYPLESFLNTGKPLVIERVIPKPLKYKEGKNLYPQI